MPSLLWHRFMSFRWYALLALFVGIFTLAGMYNPLLPAAALILGAAVWSAVSAGKEKRLGVGIIGAIAAVVLIPPLNTPLPPYTGMLIGGLWASILALTAKRPRVTVTTYNLFAAVLVLGLVGSVLAPSFPWLAILVSLFAILIGFLARSLHNSEWRLIQGGIVFLGIMQAALCGLETLVLGARISGSVTGGFHPILTDAVRAEGTLGHPLVVGMVMLAALALTLTSSLRVQTKCIYTSILLLGIFACGSSSVYIAAILTLFINYIGSGSFAFRTMKFIVAAVGSLYLLLGPSIIEPIASDVSGVNSTHRLNSIIAFPRLLTERPLVQALIGSGWGTAKENYQSGYLINDNFFSVDNQFTTVMMASGLVGMALFVVAILTALKKTHPSSRAALLTLIFMFFSFDVLSWSATAVLFIVLAGHRGPTRQRQGEQQSKGNDVGEPYNARGQLRV